MAELIINNLITKLFMPLWLRIIRVEKAIIAPVRKIVSIKH
jgi:hypothetical protein